MNCAILINEKSPKTIYDSELFHIRSGLVATDDKMIPHLVPRKLPNTIGGATPIELICWDDIGQNAVDMPLVSRPSHKMNLHGSDRSPVERGTTIADGGGKSDQKWLSSVSL